MNELHDDNTTNFVRKQGIQSIKFKMWVELSSNFCHLGDIKRPPLRTNSLYEKPTVVFSPYTHRGRVRLVRFTLEDHAYGAARLPKTSENDCFAVYNTVERVTTYKLLIYSRAEISARAEILHVIRPSVGITISNDLKWSKHIDYISKKASKRLYSLRILKKVGVCQSLPDNNKTRPILEYGVQV